MASSVKAYQRSRFLSANVLLLLAFVILTTGCETKTNNITTNAFLGDLAVAPNSRFVVVWVDGQLCMNFACRLYARVYDQTGTPVTGQFLASPTNNGFYTDIEAAINDTGFFVIVYDRYIYNPSNASLSNQLFFQRYSATGSPVGAPQFIDYGEEPDVAMTANGDFYVTYHKSNVYPNLNENIYVKKYNSTGLQTLPTILVDTAMDSSSTLRALCTGEFIVAYAAGPDNVSYAKYIRRYYPNGSPKGPRDGIDSLISLGHAYIGETLVYKPNGHFAIMGAQPSTLSGTWDYYIKRYDPNGNPSAPPEFLFNSTRLNAVLMMSGNTCGDYALIYTPDGSDTVTVREYSYDDVPVPPYAVNQAIPNIGPVIGLASVSYVAAWERVLSQSKRDTIHVIRALSVALSQPSSLNFCSCSDCPTKRLIGKPALPGYTYSWSPTTNLNNPSLAQPTVTHPGGSTPFSITYTVTITGACCKRTESVTVNFCIQPPIAPPRPQQVVPRFEIGAHFSLVSLNQPSRLVRHPQDPGFIEIAPGQVRQIGPGFGGRFTYNLTNSIAFEAEGNLFPRNEFDGVPGSLGSEPGGRVFQSQFGIKAGRRFRTFGIFGKARPGFVGFTKVNKLLSLTTPALSPPTTVGTFGVGKELYFSTDLGVVVEYYRSRRTFARFDLGDTIIRYSSFPGPGAFPSRAIIVRPPETRHNFQFNAGLGFRF